jgi:hypothetical protein
MRKGVLRVLSDSTHTLANRKVGLKPWGDGDWGGE